MAGQDDSAGRVTFASRDLCRVWTEGGEIDAEVSGRSKHFYSIYQKMESQSLDYDQIYDLVAFRVLVDTPRECYETLGVIHSQVFSGFSGKACADRIVDSESRVLITTDAYYRGGTLLDHKEKADIAVAEAAKDGHKVDKVLVWQRYPGKYSSPTPLVEGRDFIVNDVVKQYRRKRVEPARLAADAPLFLMYTSGTTGRPKGCQH